MEARIQFTLADTYRALNALALAERHAKRVISILADYPNLRGPGRVLYSHSGRETLFRAQGLLASIFWQEGRGEEAEKLFRETLAEARKLLGDKDPLTLRIKQELSTVYSTLRRDSDGLLLLQDQLKAEDHSEGALMARNALLVSSGRVRGSRSRVRGDASHYAPQCGTGTS